MSAVVCWVESQVMNNITADHHSETLQLSNVDSISPGALQKSSDRLGLLRLPALGAEHATGFSTSRVCRWPLLTTQTAQQVLCKPVY